MAWLLLLLRDTPATATLAIPWTQFLFSCLSLFAFTLPEISNAYSPWALSSATSNFPFSSSMPFPLCNLFPHFGHGTFHTLVFTTLCWNIHWSISLWKCELLKNSGYILSLYLQCPAQCLKQCVTLTDVLWINKCRKRQSLSSFSPILQAFVLDLHLLRAA